MIFLGQASNYSFRRIIRHLFAHGKRSDYNNLRSDLAARYKTSNEGVALYHSGRSALTVALKTLATPGSKVIIPGLTCIAVVRAVRAAECIPVFCDISPKDLGYDPAALDELAEECRGGILLIQNTLGTTWDIKRLEKFANKHDLKIVEDLAHSVGRFYPDERETGTVGAATVLSFGKGKAIDTINGGAVIIREPYNFSLPQPTAEPPLSDRLRDRWYPVFGGLSRVLWSVGLGKPLLAFLVHIHFIKRSGDTELDLNLRLPAWQCRLAREQLSDLISGKARHKQLFAPKPTEPHTPTTLSVASVVGPGPLREYYFVENRERCLAELAANGYQFSEIWYDTPVAPARCAGEIDFPAARCPNTIKIADAIVNLPSWVPAQKLKTAKTIIKKYQINLEKENNNE